MAEKRHPQQYFSIDLRVRAGDARIRIDVTDFAQQHDHGDWLPDGWLEPQEMVSQFYHRLNDAESLIDGEALDVVQSPSIVKGN